MMLNKALTLFDRDEEGNLIPQTVELEVNKENPKYEELKGSTIRMVPMTRGEIKRIFGSLDKTDIKDRDIDEEIVLKYCMTPEYTEEEVKYLKPEIVGPIVATIFKHSGLDMSKTKQEALKDAEDEFAKN